MTFTHSRRTFMSVFTSLAGIAAVQTGEASAQTAPSAGDLGWLDAYRGRHKQVYDYGAYDLSGNVDEWTDNLADDPGTSRPATLNGGYWGPVRNTCRLTTGGHGPTFRFYQAGFRCCADTVDGVVTPPPRPFVERDRENGVYD